MATRFDDSGDEDGDVDLEFGDAGDDLDFGDQGNPDDLYSFFGVAPPPKKTPFGVGHDVDRRAKEHGRILYPNT